MNDLTKDEKGLIKTGEGTAVNPNFISQQGMDQARNFAGIPTTINSSVLSSNQQPLTIPQVSPDTSFASLSGIASSVKDTQQQNNKLVQDQEMKALEAQSKAKESESVYKEAYNKVLETVGLRDNLSTQFKVPEKTQKVTDYTNQLDALDRAEQNEIKAVGETGILTDVQKSAKIREINRQYAFQKADVALLQSAANRDLLTAETIINNKVNAILEPLKLKLDFTKTFYEENKSSLDKQDQRLFEAKIKNDERNYNEQQTTQKNISSLLFNAVSQNAPQGVIQGIKRSKTYEEAIQAAGVYGGDMLKREKERLEVEKLRAETDKIKAGGNPQSVFDTTTPQGQLASMAQTLASKFGSKFQQESFLSNVKRYAQSGSNPQDLADYVISEALAQNPDSDSRKKSISRYSLVYKLNNLEEQLAAFYSLGGDTNIFKGTNEQIRNKLGQVSDKKLAELGISMLDTLDQIARDRTGAALTTSEEDFYNRLIPSTKKTPELNQATINGLRSSLTTDLNTILKFQLGGTGFKSIEDYLGFQANNNLIDYAKTGRLKVDPTNGNLILITN
jgi:hypothetical protein